MASSRYSAAKKKQKIDVAGDSWKAPAMWSDKRSDICNAAIRSVDKIARDLEMKWGIGKLEELAPPKLAVAFEQARQKCSCCGILARTTSPMDLDDGLLTGCRGLVASS